MCHRKRLIIPNVVNSLLWFARSRCSHSNVNLGQYFLTVPRDLKSYLVFLDFWCELKIYHEIYLVVGLNEWTKYEHGGMGY